MLPDLGVTTVDRPRIGYVIKMYPRFSETFIVTEILALEEAGWDLQVFSLRTPTDGRFHPSLAGVQAPVSYLQPNSLKAEHLWAALASYLQQVGPIDHDQLAELTRAEPRDAAQALDLARAVRAAGITHLHAHFGSVATTVARLAAMLAGIGYSFTAHAKDIFHAEVDPGDLRQKLADARAVVTVSDYNLRYLHEHYGSAASAVTRIYNGIDLEQFRFRAEEDRRVPAVPTIAAVGRLVEKKGFDDLISAAAILRDRGIAFRLQIAGAGPQADQLQAQIMINDLGDRVELLGPLPQDQVRALVGAADVFAAPCVVGADGNRDGLPTVLLEAMALGTPCVSTPVTGIPEAIEHRRTGLLVGERDVSGLVDALTELITDRGLATELARAARTKIETDYDARRQSSAVGALFESLQPVEVE